jgi:hypothetical protein
MFHLGMLHPATLFGLRGNTANASEALNLILLHRHHWAALALIGLQRLLAEP